MKEMFVIAYYGEKKTSIYADGGWEYIRLGVQIIHESPPLEIYPTEHGIKTFQPKDEFLYAKVDKRYYKED